MTTYIREQTTYRLPDGLADDLQRLHALITRVQAGEISHAELRAYRVPMGVYEQRERGTFMLRVRFPAGVVLPSHMRALAHVSRRYGNGVLHVTTRQDIQVHRVPLENLYPALADLLAAGLSTKGGGGNTVRNITACEHAGVCPHEAFDVTPYALALTEFLLPDPLSYQLPRKFKIAFAGCSRDCIGSLANDVGFIAKVRDGVPGFTVYAGGGMGNRSRVAELLEQFIPADECHLVAEAIKRVFDQHGNRKNKHRARLRFLVESIGFEAFRELYQQELARLRREHTPALAVRPTEQARPADGCAHCPASEPRDTAPAPDQPGAPHPVANNFAAWRLDNVCPQKQPAYNIVTIPLFLGDISADKLEALAAIVEAHGERALRTTQYQNAVLRWVHDGELAELHAKLAAADLAPRLPPVLRNLVACAGASTCQLGICLARGLVTAISDALTRSDLDLQALGDLEIKANGCPNACGRHPLADIGLCGAARRVGERLVPHYILQLGGQVGEGRTRLASGDTVVPARNVPAFIVEYLRAFARSPEFPSFAAFLANGGRQIAAELAEAHSYVPSFDEDKNYYFDWGAQELFSLAGRGPGECSAGVFDLIDVDLAGAEEALQRGRLYTAALSAARALLVTRGEQPEKDAEVFALFRKHFIPPGSVEQPVEEAVAEGARCAALPDPAAAFNQTKEAVAALLAKVKQLYDDMDASLRPSLREEEAPGETAAAPPPAADVEHDFRGVVCPLNYVKTKLALEQMHTGQVLAVLLDQMGAENVPASVASDGHHVLAVDQVGDHWRVVIRKATT